MQPDPSTTHARAGLIAGRCELLSRQLLAAVDCLHRRQARDVPPGNLDDFVTLGWMTWRSGALELTPAGQVVHDLVVAAGTQP